MLLLASATTALALGAGPAVADDTTVAPTTPVATSPEPTSPEPTSPEPTSPEPTKPEPTKPEPTTPEPAAQVPISAWSSDLFPPQVVIGSVRHGLEIARRTGLRVVYSVSEPVRLRADVLIFGDVSDRELRMSALPAAGPGDSLAKATLARTPTGASVVRLPFNVAARRTLRKFFKLTVRVRLIATDPAGNESTAIRRVTLTVD